MRPSWIHSPARDAAVALSWVPFAIVVHQIEPHGRQLAVVLSAVLLLSLSHQPLTLALVYGDREQRATHPWVVRVAPVVVVAAVVLALHLSFLGVAVVAGLWNAEHTLMQRYGLFRMYGRKAGDEHGPRERAALFSWLALVMVAAAANPRVPKILGEVNVGDVNRRGIALLSSARPEALILLPVAGCVVAMTTYRWLAAERHRLRSGLPVNSAKYVYAGATAALFIVMCLDPVAGFAAYVGSHALEYDDIVYTALGRRARAGGGGAAGRLARLPAGRGMFFAVTIAGLLGPMSLVQHHSTFLAATAVYLSVGAMHFILDSVIWKLRRPAVAADLGVPSSGRQVFLAVMPPSTTTTAPLM